MKKLTKVCLLPCAVGLLIGNLSAQDIHFSQWYNAPLQINPAASGAFNGDQRAIVNYKNQWAFAGSPYNTIAASFDMPFLRKKWKNAFLGGGLFLYNDKAGDSQMGTTEVTLSVSGHLRINGNNWLSAGLQGGYAQYSINTSGLQWGDMYNPSGGAPFATSDPAAKASGFGYGDFSSGLLWNYSKGEGYSTANNAFKFSAGVSWMHMNEPSIAFADIASINVNSKDQLYSKFMAHADVYIGIKGTNIVVRPNILFVQQGPTQEIIPGAFIRYSLLESSRYTGRKKETAISFGIQSRIQDSYIATVLFEFANYAMGLSYDINSSDLTTVSKGNGGFELSLRYINPNPFRNVSSARFD